MMKKKINAMKEFFIDYDENIIIEWYIIYILDQNLKILPEYLKINLDVLQHGLF